MPLPDTIAAIATAPGEGAIGIVRISGPDATSTLLRIFRTPDGGRVEERHFPSQRMRYGMAVDPDTGDRLDEILAVRMVAPGTYTREDMVELHGHGGTAVLRRLLEVVLVSGARLAGPGEFTKRAFLNGRIELHQAEAVIDIIRARTDRAASAALASLSGTTNQAIEGLRRDILSLAAHVEAWIDFPEEDIPTGDRQSLLDRARRIRGAIEELLRTFREGRILREGLAVAIVGRPNVGKSSLLNALLRTERAIVAGTPGTTRDTIEEDWNLGGIPLRLVDTAGIRDPSDEIEAAGVKRSRGALALADLALVVLDGSEPLSAEDQTLLEEVSGRPGLIVVNKSDLPPAFDPSMQRRICGSAQPCVRISAKYGDGIGELRGAIEHAALGEGSARETPLISRRRHRAALEKALLHLEGFVQGLTEDRTPEILAVDIQDLREAMGVLVGVTAPDDVLDAIFSEFCIGK